MMERIPQISESELALMKMIWENSGSMLYADIVDGLEQKDLDWKKNTILTFLSRLVDKKMLITTKSGRRNIYTALISEEQYRAEQTKSFVEKVYDGNVSGLVNMLVNSSMVTEADVDALRTFWERNHANE